MSHTDFHNATKLSDGVALDKPIACQLPNQVVLLGQALRPVSDSLHDTLRRQDRRGKAIESDGGSDPVKHLTAISEVMEQQGCWILELKNSVLQNDQATSIEVGFVAGRLEQLLRPLTDGYSKLLSIRPIEEAQDETLELLLSAYRHILTEVSEWLDRLVRTAQDPLEELRRQNLPLADGIVIPVDLNLTTPPAYDRLHEMFIAKSTPLVDEEYKTSLPVPSPPGFWGKTGAAVFGMGLAATLWKRDS